MTHNLLEPRNVEHHVDRAEEAMRRLAAVPSLIVPPEQRLQNAVERGDRAISAATLTANLVRLIVPISHGTAGSETQFSSAASSLPPVLRSAVEAAPALMNSTDESVRHRGEDIVRAAMFFVQNSSTVLAPDAVQLRDRFFAYVQALSQGRTPENSFDQIVSGISSIPIQERPGVLRALRSEHERLTALVADAANTVLRPQIQQLLVDLSTTITSLERGDAVGRNVTGSLATRVLALNAALGNISDIDSPAVLAAVSPILSAGLDSLSRGASRRVYEIFSLAAIQIGTSPATGVESPYARQLSQAAEVLRHSSTPADMEAVSQRVLVQLGTVISQQLDVAASGPEGQLIGTAPGQMARIVRAATETPASESAYSTIVSGSYSLIMLSHLHGLLGPAISVDETTRTNLVDIFRRGFNALASGATPNLDLAMAEDVLAQRFAGSNHPTDRRQILAFSQFLPSRPENSNDAFGNTRTIYSQFTQLGSQIESFEALANRLPVHSPARVVIENVITALNNAREHFSRTGVPVTPEQLELTITHLRERLPTDSEFRAQIEDLVRQGVSQDFAFAAIARTQLNDSFLVNLPRSVQLFFQSFHDRQLQDRFAPILASAISSYTQGNISEGDLFVGGIQLCRSLLSRDDQQIVITTAQDFSEGRLNAASASGVFAALEQLVRYGQHSRNPAVHRYFLQAVEGARSGNEEAFRTTLDLATLYARSVAQSTTGLSPELARTRQDDIEFSQIRLDAHPEIPRPATTEPGSTTEPRTTTSERGAHTRVPLSISQTDESLSTSHLEIAERSLHVEEFEFNRRVNAALGTGRGAEQRSIRAHSHELTRLQRSHDQAQLDLADREFVTRSAEDARTIHAEGMQLLRRGMELSQRAEQARAAGNTEEATRFSTEARGFIEQGQIKVQASTQMINALDAFEDSFRLNTRHRTEGRSQLAEAILAFSEIGRGETPTASGQTSGPPLSSEEARARLESLTQSLQAGVQAVRMQERVQHMRDRGIHNARAHIHFEGLTRANGQINRLIENMPEAERAPYQERLRNATQHQDVNSMQSLFYELSIRRLINRPPTSAGAIPEVERAGYRARLQAAVSAHNLDALGVLYSELGRRVTLTTTNTPSVERSSGVRANPPDLELGDHTFDVRRNERRYRHVVSLYQRERFPQANRAMGSATTALYLESNRSHNLLVTLEREDANRLATNPNGTAFGLRSPGSAGQPAEMTPAFLQELLDNLPPGSEHNALNQRLAALRRSRLNTQDAASMSRYYQELESIHTGLFTQLHMTADYELRARRGEILAYDARAFDRRLSAAQQELALGNTNVASVANSTISRDMQQAEQQQVLHTERANERFIQYNREFARDEAQIQVDSNSATSSRIILQRTDVGVQQRSCDEHDETARAFMRVAQSLTDNPTARLVIADASVVNTMLHGLPANHDPRLDALATRMNDEHANPIERERARRELLGRIANDRATFNDAMAELATARSASGIPIYGEIELSHLRAQGLVARTAFRDRNRDTRQLALATAYAALQREAELASSPTTAGSAILSEITHLLPGVEEDNPREHQDDAARHVDHTAAFLLRWTRAEHDSDFIDVLVAGRGGEDSLARVRGEDTFAGQLQSVNQRCAFLFAGQSASELWLDRGGAVRTMTQHATEITLASLRRAGFDVSRTGRQNIPGEQRWTITPVERTAAERQRIDDAYNQLMEADQALYTELMRSASGGVLTQAVSAGTELTYLQRVSAASHAYSQATALSADQDEWRRLYTRGTSQFSESERTRSDVHMYQDIGGGLDIVSNVALAGIAFASGGWLAAGMGIYMGAGMFDRATNYYVQNGYWEGMSDRQRAWFVGQMALAVGAVAMPIGGEATSIGRTLATEAAQGTRVLNAGQRLFIRAIGAVPTVQAAPMSLSFGQRVLTIVRGASNITRLERGLHFAGHAQMIAMGGESIAGFSEMQEAYRRGDIGVFSFGAGIFQSVLLPLQVGLQGYRTTLNLEGRRLGTSWYGRYVPAPVRFMGEVLLGTNFETIHQISEGAAYTRAYQVETRGLSPVQREQFRLAEHHMNRQFSPEEARVAAARVRAGDSPEVAARAVEMAPHVENVMALYTRAHEAARSSGTTPEPAVLAENYFLDSFGATLFHNLIRRGVSPEAARAELQGHVERTASNAAFRVSMSHQVGQVLVPTPLSSPADRIKLDLALFLLRAGRLDPATSARLDLSPDEVQVVESRLRLERAYERYSASGGRATARELGITDEHLAVFARVREAGQRYIEFNSAVTTDAPDQILSPTDRVLQRIASTKGPEAAAARLVEDTVGSSIEGTVISHSTSTQAVESSTTEPQTSQIQTPEQLRASAQELRIRAMALEARWSTLNNSADFNAAVDAEEARATQLPSSSSRQDARLRVQAQQEMRLREIATLERLAAALEAQASRPRPQNQVPQGQVVAHEPSEGTSPIVPVQEVPVANPEINPVAPEAQIPVAQGVPSVESRPTARQHNLFTQEQSETFDALATQFEQARAAQDSGDLPTARRILRDVEQRIEREVDAAAGELLNAQRSGNREEIERAEQRVDYLLDIQNALVHSGLRPSVLSTRESIAAAAVHTVTQLRGASSRTDALATQTPAMPNSVSGASFDLSTEAARLIGDAAPSLHLSSADQSGAIVRAQQLSEAYEAWVQNELVPSTAHQLNIGPDEVALFTRLSADSNTSPQLIAQSLANHATGRSSLSEPLVGPVETVRTPAEDILQNPGPERAVARLEVEARRSLPQEAQPVARAQPLQMAAGAEGLSQAPSISTPASEGSSTPLGIRARQAQVLGSAAASERMARALEETVGHLPRDPSLEHAIESLPQPARNVGRVIDHLVSQVSAVVDLRRVGQREVEVTDVDLVNVPEEYRDAVRMICRVQPDVRDPNLFLREYAQQITLTRMTSELERQFAVQGVDSRSQEARVARSLLRVIYDPAHADMNDNVHAMAVRPADFDRIGAALTRGENGIPEIFEVAGVSAERQAISAASSARQTMFHGSGPEVTGSEVRPESGPSVARFSPTSSEDGSPLLADVALNVPTSRGISSEQAAQLNRVARVVADNTAVAQSWENLAVGSHYVPGLDSALETRASESGLDTSAGRRNVIASAGAMDLIMNSFYGVQIARGISVEDLSLPPEYGPSLVRLAEVRRTRPSEYPEALLQAAREINSARVGGAQPQAGDQTEVSFTMTPERVLQTHTENLLGQYTVFEEAGRTGARVHFTDELSRLNQLTLNNPLPIDPQARRAAIRQMAERATVDVMTARQIVVDSENRINLNDAFNMVDQARAGNVDAQRMANSHYQRALQNEVAASARASLGEAGTPARVSEPPQQPLTRASQEQAQIRVPQEQPQIRAPQESAVHAEQAPVTNPEREARVDLLVAAYSRGMRGRVDARHLWVDQVMSEMEIAAYERGESLQELMRNPTERQRLIRAAADEAIRRVESGMQQNPTEMVQINLRVSEIRDQYRMRGVETPDAAHVLATRIRQGIGFDLSQGRFSLDDQAGNRDQAIVGRVNELIRTAESAEDLIRRSLSGTPEQRELAERMIPALESYVSSQLARLNDERVVTPLDRPVEVQRIQRTVEFLVTWASGGYESAQTGRAPDPSLVAARYNYIRENINTRDAATFAELAWRGIMNSAATAVVTPVAERANVTQAVINNLCGAITSTPNPGGVHPTEAYFQQTLANFISRIPEEWIAQSGQSRENLLALARGNEQRRDILTNILNHSVLNTHGLAILSMEHGGDIYTEGVGLYRVTHNIAANGLDRINAFVIDVLPGQTEVLGRAGGYFDPSAHMIVIRSETGSNQLGDRGPSVYGHELGHVMNHATGFSSRATQAANVRAAGNLEAARAERNRLEEGTAIAHEARVLLQQGRSNSSIQRMLDDVAGGRPPWNLAGQNVGDIFRTASREARRERLSPQAINERIQQRLLEYINRTYRESAQAAGSTPLGFSDFFPGQRANLSIPQVLDHFDAISGAATPRRVRSPDQFGTQVVMGAGAAQAARILRASEPSVAPAEQVPVPREAAPVGESVNFNFRDERGVPMTDREDIIDALGRLLVQRANPVLGAAPPNIPESLSGLPVFREMLNYVRRNPTEERIRSAARTIVDSSGGVSALDAGLSGQDLANNLGWIARPREFEQALDSESGLPRTDQNNNARRVARALDILVNSPVRVEDLPLDLRQSVINLRVAAQERSVRRFGARPSREQMIERTIAEARRITPLLEGGATGERASPAPSAPVQRPLVAEVVPQTTSPISAPSDIREPIIRELAAARAARENRAVAPADVAAVTHSLNNAERFVDRLAATSSSRSAGAAERVEMFRQFTLLGATSEGVELQTAILRRLGGSDYELVLQRPAIISHLNTLMRISGSEGVALARFLGLDPNQFRADAANRVLLAGIFNGDTQLIRFLAENGLEIHTNPEQVNELLSIILSGRVCNYLSALSAETPPEGVARRPPVPLVTRDAAGHVTSPPVVIESHRSGMSGAYEFNFRDVYGQERSIFFKPVDMAAERFGGECSRISGAITPNIVDRDATGRPFTYVTPDGTVHNFGFSHNIRESAPPLRLDIGGGSQAEFRPAMVASLNHLDSVPVENLRIMFGSAEAREAFWESFWFYHIGSFAGGVADRHGGNVWPILYRSETPLSVQQIATLRRSGQQVFTHDGQQYVIRFGGIDNDAGGAYIAGPGRRGSFDFSSGDASAVGYWRGAMQLALDSIATAQSRVFSGRITVEDMAAEAFAPGDARRGIPGFRRRVDTPFQRALDRWMSQHGNNPEYRARMHELFRSYDGRPAGIGATMEFNQAVRDSHEQYGSFYMPHGGRYGEEFQSARFTDGRVEMRVHYEYVQLTTPEINRRLSWLTGGAQPEYGRDLLLVPQEHAGIIPAGASRREVTAPNGRRFVVVGADSVPASFRTEVSGTMRVRIDIPMDQTYSWTPEQGGGILRADFGFVRSTRTRVDAREAGAEPIFDYILNGGRPVVMHDFFRGVMRGMAGEHTGTVPVRTLRPTVERTEPGFETPTMPPPPPPSRERVIPAHVTTEPESSETRARVESSATTRPALSSAPREAPVISAESDVFYGLNHQPEAIAAQEHGTRSLPIRSVPVPSFGRSTEPLTPVMTRVVEEARQLFAEVRTRTGHIATEEEIMSFASARVERERILGMTERDLVRHTTENNPEVAYRGSVGRDASGDYVEFEPRGGVNGRDESGAQVVYEPMRGPAMQRIRIPVYRENPSESAQQYYSRMIGEAVTAQNHSFESGRAALDAALNRRGPAPRESDFPDAASFRRASIAYEQVAINAQELHSAMYGHTGLQLGRRGVRLAESTAHEGARPESSTSYYFMAHEVMNRIRAGASEQDVILSVARQMAEGRPVVVTPETARLHSQILYNYQYDLVAFRASQPDAPPELVRAFREFQVRFGSAGLDDHGRIRYNQSDVQISPALQRQYTAQVLEQFQGSYLPADLRARFMQNPMPVVTVENEQFMSIYALDIGRSVSSIGAFVIHSTNHIFIPGRLSSAERFITTVSHEMHHAASRTLGGGDTSRLWTITGTDGRPLQVEFNNQFHESMTEYNARRMAMNLGYSGSSNSYSGGVASVHYVREIVAEHFVNIEHISLEQARMQADAVISRMYHEGDMETVSRIVDNRLGAGTFSVLTGHGEAEPGVRLNGMDVMVHFLVQRMSHPLPNPDGTARMPFDIAAAARGGGAMLSSCTIYIDPRIRYSNPEAFPPPSMEQYRQSGVIEGLRGWLRSVENQNPRMAQQISPHAENLQMAIYGMLDPNSTVTLPDGRSVPASTYTSRVREALRLIGREGTLPGGSIPSTDLSPAMAIMVVASQISREMGVVGSSEPVVTPEGGVRVTPNVRPSEPRPNELPVARPNEPVVQRINEPPAARANEPNTTRSNEQTTTRANEPVIRPSEQPAQNERPTRRAALRASAQTGEPIVSGLGSHTEPPAAAGQRSSTTIPTIGSPQGLREFVGKLIDNDPDALARFNALPRSIRGQIEQFRRNPRFLEDQNKLNSAAVRISRELFEMVLSQAPEPEVRPGSILYRAQVAGLDIRHINYYNQRISEPSLENGHLVVRDLNSGAVYRVNDVLEWKVETSDGLRRNIQARDDPNLVFVLQERYSTYREALYTRLVETEFRAQTSALTIGEFRTNLEQGISAEFLGDFSRFGNARTIQEFQTALLGFLNSRPETRFTPAQIQFIANRISTRLNVGAMDVAAMTIGRQNLSLLDIVNSVYLSTEGFVHDNAGRTRVYLWRDAGGFMAVDSIIAQQHGYPPPSGVLVNRVSFGQAGVGRTAAGRVDSVQATRYFEGTVRNMVEEARVASEGSSDRYMAFMTQLRQRIRTLRTSDQTFDEACRQMLVHLEQNGIINPNSPRVFDGVFIDSSSKTLLPFTKALLETVYGDRVRIDIQYFHVAEGYEFLPNLRVPKPIIDAIESAGANNSFVVNNQDYERIDMHSPTRMRDSILYFLLLRNRALAQP